MDPRDAALTNQQASSGRETGRLRYAYTCRRRETSRCCVVWPGGGLHFPR